MSKGQGNAVMRVVLAPNAFKGAIDAPAAAAAMRRGVTAACPQMEAVDVPMADGGDGTAAVLCAALGGSSYALPVEDAWGRSHTASLVLLQDGSAVIDVAAASGLGGHRPAPHEALTASTWGTGLLVRAAVQRGARRIRLALGGSATSDGGAGLLGALGAVVRDANGRPIPPGGGALATATEVDLTGLQWLQGIQWEALVDVTTPLLGLSGTARVFAPQKGVRPEDIPHLESALTHWADILERATGRRGRDLAGAGAAGGLGFGLAVGLQGLLRPGAAAVAEAVHLEDRLAGAALVLTGEGALDAQTPHGKAPAIVGRMAQAAGIPCCALVGALGDGWAGALPTCGLTAAFTIVNGPLPRIQALQATADDLTRVSAMVVRLFTAGGASRR